MGIYDRDYYREQQPGVALRGPRTMVGILILINVAVFLANLLLTGGTKGMPLSPQNDTIAYWLSVRSDTLTQPWMWWQFLTYGFVHDPHNFGHILVNMIVLWMFGRPIETIYGPKEFLRLYLAMVVLGSLVWTVSNKLMGMPGTIPMMGAAISGAVVGVLILFVFHFPRQTILFMFVLPMPAWLFGMLLVGYNLFWAVSRAEGDNVAYTVHLTGAAFAFLYHRFGWRLSGLLGFQIPWAKLKPKPKLRIHDPTQRAAELTAEVDRILEKIHRSGEGSLTRKERRVLEDASRQYQRRRPG